jgi:hypothetical protein
MSAKSAFLVEEANLIGDELWLVRGKAYETVRVGDVLVVPVDVRGTDIQFKVVSLSTHSRKVQTFSAMSTGDMILSGPNGDVLKETSWLLLA